MVGNLCYSVQRLERQGIILHHISVSNMIPCQFTPSSTRCPTHQTERARSVWAAFLVLDYFAHLNPNLSLILAIQIMYAQEETNMT